MAWGGGIACSADAPQTPPGEQTPAASKPAANSQALSTAVGQAKWATSADGLVHIPVCFKTETALDPGITPRALFPLPSQYTIEWIRSSIERTWNTVSNVRFEEFVMCPNDCSKQYAVVMLGDITVATAPTPTIDPSGGISAVGPGLVCPDAVTTNFNAPTSFGYSSVYTPRKRIEYIAVHEFGHLLGFDHEQYRLDRDVFNDNIEMDDGGSGEAGPRSYLGAFDTDSIMNYNQYKVENSTESNSSGALTNLDIQGVQAFYAPNPATDDDRDTWLDRQDNCPYANNRDQLNSNFEAELVVARRSGFPADDGHVPTAADPASYVTRWQATYRGDACDPVALAPATIDNTPTAANGNTCSPGSTALKSAAAVSIVGLRGDPVGARKPSVRGVGAGAVCRCDLPSTSDDLIECGKSVIARCRVAEDLTFPTLPTPAASGYRTMKDCDTASNFATLTTVSKQLTAPVGVWGYMPSPTAAKIWDSKYDSDVLGIPAGKLRAIVWSQAQRPTSTSPFNPFPPLIPPTVGPFTPDLRNHYQSTTTAIAFAGVNPVATCAWCAPAWDYLGWRDAISAPPILVYGQSPTDGRIPQAQTPLGMATETERLNASALAAFNLANTEIIMAQDNVTSAIRGRAKYTGLLINGGTGFVRGAFSVADNKRIDFAAGSGLVDQNIPASVRLFAALEGPAGALITVRGQTLDMQSVENAMRGAPSIATATFSGDTPVEPRAAAWDGPTRRLYMIDQTAPSATTRQLRLLAIQGATGKSKVLWAGPVQALSAMPSKVYVQTTAQQELLIAYSYASGSQWAIVDYLGTALRSGTLATAFGMAPLLTDAALVAPIARPAGYALNKGPFVLQQTARAQLAPGNCAASWFKSVTPSRDCGDAWTGAEPTATPSSPGCRNVKQ